MSENIPTNKALYSRVKSEAKQKFDSWPSAYGSAWLVKEYKRRGGTYRKAQDGMEVPEEYMHGGMLYGDSAYMYGGEDTDMVEYAKGGGIPERYKKMGFNKVGVKKKSTRPGKKWMVLAKKGDKYKVVHGGYVGMKDFTQHKNKKRQERFWDRMGGRDSAKAKDPFSPLYWHKRFGTWEEGGETFNEDSMDFYEKGGGIHLDSKNKGTFKAAATRMGMSMDDAAKEILSAEEGKYSPTLRRKANFYKNFVMQGGGAVFNEDSQDFYAYGGGIPVYQTAGEWPDLTMEELDPQTLADLEAMGQMDEAPFEFIPGKSDNMRTTKNWMMRKDEGFLPTFTHKSGFKIEDPFNDLTNMQKSMGRIALANIANKYMENTAAQKQQAQMRTNNLTDNFIPLDAPTDRGDYDINTGIFRPNDYVPVQFQAQYQSGGQIGMVDDELLKELIAAGADIELLD